MSSYCSVNWVTSRTKLDPATGERIPPQDDTNLVTFIPRSDVLKLRLKLKELSPILTAPTYLALCVNLLLEGSITLEKKGLDYVIRATDSTTN